MTEEEQVAHIYAMLITPFLMTEEERDYYRWLLGITEEGAARAREHLLHEIEKVLAKQ